MKFPFVFLGIWQMLIVSSTNNGNSFRKRLQRIFFLDFSRNLSEPHLASFKLIFHLLSHDHLLFPWDRNLPYNLHTGIELNKCLFVQTQQLFMSFYYY